MPVTVTLAGPAPWGFRITGGRDFGKPITVSKVMERGKAAAGDLRLGDIIVTINGESTAEMLNVEAQNKIKQSPGQLQLQVERSLTPTPSHTNGDTSPEKVAARFQAARGYFGVHPCTLCSPKPSPLAAPDLSLSQPLTTPPRPPTLPPSPTPPRGPCLPCHRCRQPPPRRAGSAPDPAGTVAPGRGCFTRSYPAPLGNGTSLGRPNQEDSEVYKMLQENRELRAAPRQSSTFRLLQEALEDEGEEGAGGFGGWRRGHTRGAPLMPPVPVSRRTQAVRIQDGRYRHASCYACADCGLNLKMRGHFWVGDELYCEKHARLRYQGASGGPAALPVSPQS
ncbi:PDLI2 protein, partial [Heliornis fulica]|nr:PDLI2 protein [Heliornis fulica]